MYNFILIDMQRLFSLIFRVIIRLSCEPMDRTMAAAQKIMVT